MPRTRRRTRWPTDSKEPPQLSPHILWSTFNMISLYVRVVQFIVMLLLPPDAYKFHSPSVIQPAQSVSHSLGSVNVCRGEKVNACACYWCYCWMMMNIVCGWLDGWTRSRWSRWCLIQEGWRLLCEHNKKYLHSIHFSLTIFCSTCILNIVSRIAQIKI